MKALVLGGMGFIGSWVTERLALVGANVRVIDSLDERVHHGRPADPRIDLTVAEYGYAPYPEMAWADTVIHLAAQVGVADSMTDPARYMEQNSLDTARFLKELSRHKGIKRLVVASSMSVYGEGGMQIREDAPCIPQSVYGLSKYDQERLCLMWGAMQNIPVVALRFFNVYGPRQALDNPYTGVLANFAQRILAGEPPIVFEDGQQTRDFVYVEDVANAVVGAAMPKSVLGVYNICTGKATTISHAASALCRALGREDITPVITGETRPGDIRYCTGDPEAADRVLGWRATTSFDEGIEQYAQWLKRV